MVRLGTSRIEPDGVPSPPVGCGLGPPENPLFTDPGGAGTSVELLGFNPAMTSETSVGIAPFAVSTGGGAAIVAGPAGGAACLAGGTNFSGCRGSDRVAVKLVAAEATSGAAGKVAGSKGRV